jgi:hypothetical protein
MGLLVLVIANTALGLEIAYSWVVSLPVPLQVLLVPSLCTAALCGHLLLIIAHNGTDHVPDIFLSSIILFQ